MTQETAFILPTYKEIGDSQGLIAATYYVETAVNVKNARIVKADSNEYSIEVAGDECISPLGWVCRELTNDNFAESDRTTDYTAGDYVGVARGNIAVVGYTTDSGIGIGDMLVCAAAGAVKEYSSDTHITRVGYAMMDYDSGTFLLIKSII